MADVSGFGPRLKQLRESAGLTQPQLAIKAGLTAAGVAQLEQGRRKPAWETVLALCEALDLSCEEFRKEPAEREPSGAGRPRKDAGQVVGGEAVAEPPAEAKPSGRKPKPKGKRKGKG